MTLTTRDSGKCLVPTNIYRALLSLPQTACSVHSKFWRSLSGKSFRSDMLHCSIVCSQWSARGQDFGGEQGLCGCLLAAATSSAFRPAAFLNRSFLSIGFPQTWAWAWGWAVRTPRVITSKAVPPALSQMTIIFTVTFQMHFAKVSKLCVITMGPWKWEMESDMTWRIVFSACYRCWGRCIIISWKSFIPARGYFIQRTHFSHLLIYIFYYKEFTHKTGE